MEFVEFHRKKLEKGENSDNFPPFLISFDGILQIRKKGTKFLNTSSGGKALRYFERSHFRHFNDLNGRGREPIS